MAKSKPIPKAEPKKFVPTTGIFKHVTRSKKRRWEAHKAQHTAKKTVEKHLQASPKRKSKQTPNHSLAIAFATAVESSRSHITDEVNSSIESSFQSLQKRLASSNRHFEGKLQTMKASTEELLMPLSQDELHFKSNDGKLAGTQNLGDRMRQFKNLVAQEEKRLEALWEQWIDVQQNMENLALEALGPKGVESIAHQSTSKLPEYEGSFHKSIAEEIEKERKGWEDKIAKMSKASIAKMRADEEEAKLLRKKLKKDFLQLLETEI